MTATDSHQSHEEQTGNSGQLPPTDRSATIRALNDRLRITGAGGIVLMTDGVAALSLAGADVLSALARYDDFRDENDPWNEHEFGVLKIDGEHVLWKIDYYDRTRTSLSP